MRGLLLALLVVGTCTHAEQVTYEVDGTVTSTQLTVVTNSTGPIPQSPYSSFYGTLGQQASFDFIVNTMTNTIFNGGNNVSGGAGFSSSFNPSPLTASATAFQTSGFVSNSFNLAGDQLQISESSSEGVPQDGGGVATYAWTYVTDISNLVISAFDTQTGAPVTVGAPEMDPSSAASALTLLLGGLAVFRSRMNRNREHSPAN